jgi:metal-responsive CopG/Arc/MetJ family transcriptional regulator
MKVAVSLPDPVFEAAERTARRLRVSRSRLYARALEAYVGLHGGKDITERLNAVYARRGPSAPRTDPFIEAMSLEILRRQRW